MLAPALTVDYCPSAGPVAGVFDWFLLLNGIGVVLLTFRRLGQLRRR
jgi:hypothetical protein